MGNCYCIDHSYGYFMIDCGMPEKLETIRENMRYWKIDENKITHIFLTHAHDDHSGCAAFFQKTGAKIVIGKEDEYMLERGDMGEYNPCKNHTIPPFKADILLENDTDLKVGDITVKAIKAPGHTDGSFLYLSKIEDDLVLFSGDTFYIEGQNGELVITGWKGDTSYNADKLTASFDRIYRMGIQPDLVLGGHGIPRFGKEAKIIEMAYRYHLKNNR